MRTDAIFLLCRQQPQPQEFELLSQPQPVLQPQPQPPQPNSRMMMSRMTIQDVLLQELQNIMISFLRV